MYLIISRGGHLVMTEPTNQRMALTSGIFGLLPGWWLSEYNPIGLYTELTPSCRCRETQILGTTNDSVPMERGIAVSGTIGSAAIHT
jgi:hypothetical protein